MTARAATRPGGSPSRLLYSLPAMSLIETRPSPIHATGVFAKRAIASGAFIGRFAGRRTDRQTDHTLWVEVGEEVRGYEGTGRLRYLNHSRSPNAEFEGRDLYALRRIRAGEEITIDYGPDWADTP